MSKNFEPYIDFDAIDDRMTDDLHEAASAYKQATESFMKEKSKENAANLLRTQHRITEIAHAINASLYTQPVMVHIAGEKSHDSDEDGRDQAIQRCKRCGSVLQIWKTGWAAMTPAGPHRLEEEDLPWWEEDDLVAKNSDNESMTMYEIEKNRDLEKHEFPCLDLTSLAST